MASLEEVIDKIIKAYVDPTHGNKELEKLIEHEKYKATRRGYDAGYKAGQSQLRREIRALLGIKKSEE